LGDAAVAEHKNHQQDHAVIFLIEFLPGSDIANMTPSQQR
jgi:hypothetical protein